MRSTLFILPFINCVFIAFSLCSCNNSPESIPFSTDDTTYRLVGEPLKLSQPVKVIFDTSNHRHVTPLIKKFDLSKLPTRVFDSSGFQPFLKPPEETHFNWDSLPTKDFDLDSIPAKTLTFKTSLLPPPKLTKAGEPGYVEPGILELGDEQGIIGELFSFKSLFEDSKGILWIPTDKVLYQYDGENLRCYPILNKVFSHLAEDNLGNIWISNWGEGLHILDLRHGTSKSLNTDKGISFQYSAPSGVINDKQGNMWISTGNNGVYIINQGLGTIKNISAAQGLSDSTVHAIKIDNLGSVWIGTTKGINIIDLKNRKIKLLTKEHGISNDIINAMCDGNDGQMIISNRNEINDLNPGPGKVDIMDSKKGIIKHLSPGQGLDSASSFALLQNSNGDIFIGTTGDGIDIINLKNSMFKHLNKKNGLSYNFVFDLVRDSLGTIWAADIASIYMIGQDDFSIEHIGKNSVVGIVEDPTGLIWIAFRDGIDILDPRTGLAKSLTTKQGLSSVQLQNLMEDNGKIYITSDDGGLDIVDPAHQTLEHMGKAQGLGTDSTGGVVLKDKNGRLWISESNKGLEIYDPVTKKILVLDTLNGLIGNSPEDFRIDRQNNIWIATADKGIDIFNPVDNTIRHLLNAGGLQDMSHKWLGMDDKGRIWIGSGSGIYMVDLPKNTLSTFHTPDGSPIPNVGSLTWHDGRLYIHSSEGLSIIIPSSFDSISSEKIGWRVESYSKSQGFINLFRGAINDVLTKKGEFWYGDSGIHILHKNVENKAIQKTSITGFDFLKEHYLFSDAALFETHTVDTIWSINNDTFYLKGQLPIQSASGRGITWDSVTGSYNIPVNLRLPYNLNVIRFSFTGASPGSTHKIKYKYILEGVDKKWSDITGMPYSEYYVNLQPGKYKFKVAGKGFTGLWGPPAEFSFTIMPPWWNTWWAWFLYAAVFSLVVWSSVQYRSHQLKKENRLLEITVAERTSALNKSVTELKATQSRLIQAEKAELKQKDAELKQLKAEFEKQITETEMEALRAQMNPHFIFNVLNSINKYILSNDKSMASDYLVQFSRLIRLTLENSKAAKVPLQNDLEALRIYISMEKIRFGNQFNFAIEVNENIDQQFTQIPPLLIQPYVENAIWHGLMQKDHPGYLSIKITESEDSIIQVVVLDNGIGRKSSAELKSKSATVHKSYGMQITGDRIKRVNSLYNTNATVEVEDLYDGNNQPGGTKVTLLIPA